MSEWNRQQTENEREALGADSHNGNAKAGNRSPLLLILLLVGILALFGVASYFVLRNNGPAKKEMTRDELTQLASNGMALTMDQLQEYQGTGNKTGEKRFYHIHFNDQYAVFAVEDLKTKTLETCTLTDRVSGEQIDLRRDDVVAFFRRTYKS